jgi:hypothetical protein
MRGYGHKSKKPQALGTGSAFWYGERLRPGHKPGPGPPGVSSRCTDVHANTAGLHASAAMGLSGRLEFDSSNHGLC